MEESVKLRIVGVCGSLRSQSYTRMAVALALQGAEEVGAMTSLVDLRDRNLIFSDGREHEKSYPEDVFTLRKELKEANGIILGTPEYHGSFSGVLKNAIDLMGFKEFEGKIMGLVGVSGGALGAVNALNGLRVVGRALHAWVIPQQVSVPEAWRVFNEDGGIHDAAIEERLKDLGRKVARFAYLHNSEQAREFLEAWENAPLNPGG
jgi:NAD(P)H-dependent FMN reductase